MVHHRLVRDDLEGALVRLRPVREEDLPVMATAREWSEFLDYEDEPQEDLAARWAKDRFAGPSPGRYVVERRDDGEFLGFVTWHRRPWGPGARSWAWNIGIALRPAARGRGFGSEAQRLLADHLLGTSGGHRVEAVTDVDNTPEQRALEKAGFRYEGRVSAAQWRGGRPRDVLLYARLRTDV